MELNSPLRIRFLGAAETVTGSKYLLTFNEQKVLVDCGLFQGLKELRLKNWDRFPIEPREIKAIILTHAHIDHSGYIPKLIREGFRGKIYCTPATKALCEILLPDTGYLQEEEAEWMNRKKISRHSPALPLFTKEEAKKALDYFVTYDFDEKFTVLPGLNVSFRYAGHILGAASAIVEANDRTVAFSGDVGRLHDPILYPPAHLPKIDYLIVESTYGNKLHPRVDPKDELEEIIRQAAEKNGVVLIPAFTVGRAQSLMYYLAQLKREGHLPSIPIYLNSPMATNVTELFSHFSSAHKLTNSECDSMFRIVRYIQSVEESQSLNKKKGPMVIISASGMATGGRILHHLREFAPDPKTSIVLTGYQAAGTRGRKLQDGCEDIKIHRRSVPVRAKVITLENISAHADSKEIIDWLRESQVRPKKVFVTHGESDSAQALSSEIKNELDWQSLVPKMDQEFVLD